LGVYLLAPVTERLDNFDVVVCSVGRFFGETFRIIDFINGAINPYILFLDKEPFMLTTIRE
jgi:hypothetical protein